MNVPPWQILGALLWGGGAALDCRKLGHAWGSWFVGLELADPLTGERLEKRQCERCGVIESRAVGP